MSKRFLLDNCILEVANKYSVTVNDLEDSIQELLYCALYCDYTPKCKLVVIEDYKTTLTALGELAKIYNIHGELAAWVLIDLWEILDEDKDLVECRVEVCTNRETKFIINSPNRIVDITAIRKEVQEQQFLNSVKALDVKPNDVVIASLIPNQMSMKKAESIFKQMMQIFPDNQVSLVMGLDVTIKNGED